MAPICSRCRSASRKVRTKGSVREGSLCPDVMFSMWFQNQVVQCRPFLRARGEALWKIRETVFLRVAGDVVHAAEMLFLSSISGDPACRDAASFEEPPLFFFAQPGGSTGSMLGLHVSAVLLVPLVPL